MGRAAKSNSRLCFTLVRVTAPTTPRTPLPTKLAVAEKHMGCDLRCEDTDIVAGGKHFSGGLVWISRLSADRDCTRRLWNTTLAQPARRDGASAVGGGIGGRGRPPHMPIG